MKYFLISFIPFFTSLNIHSQTLLRKASIGVVAKPVSEGIRVDSVLPNTTAQALKLQKNDIITRLNEKDVLTYEKYASVASNLRTNDPLQITILREGKKKTVSGKALMRPMETSPIADISYDWVKFRNGYLRTITRKPKNKANMPCILLIPGYGCGSIENYSQSYNGKLMNEWLQNGYAVVTIEKSGMGDSYDCAPCSEADLATDIESYDTGYKYMEDLSFVDKNALFIWGHSLGGMVAPEIAKRHHPKGVMVFGTVFRPWSEFLPEMHRIQKPLLDSMSYIEAEKFSRLIQKVYYEFFVLKKTRQQLFENPEYHEIVRTELEHKENS